MIKRVVFAGLALALAGFMVVPTSAEAQFGSLGKKLKQKAEERLDRKEDQAAEAMVNAADQAVTCAVTDQACIDEAQESGKPVKVTDASGNPVSSQDSAAALAGGRTMAKPGEGAWANYDFKPGERPLFVDDFSRDNVGDFPRRLEFKEGTLEVVEWSGARFLRATSFGTFYVPLPEVLPERFTVEFDYAGPGGWNTEIYFGDETTRPTYVTFSSYAGGVDGGGIRAIGNPSHPYEDEMFPVRIMVDGKYVKVYMGEKRVANVPNANLGRANRIQVDFGASNDDPVMIGNLRVMAGGKELYDDLAADGRVATQGIYFDTGSDRIRPESTPTLKEIGEMLTAHADLRLRIEGHTDNTGTAEGNQALSEKRANAVRQFLIDAYGIGADRLEAAGLGQTKPAAPNDTPEGRQQNRRVELVKL